MNERQLQFRVGMLAILSLGIGAWLVVQFGELRDLWQPTYVVEAAFEQAPGVFPGTPIKTNGVKIGSVREVTLDAYFSLLKNRSKRSGFSLREYEEEGTRKLVVQHEMGRHWSVFFKAHHEQVIYNAGYKAKVEYTDNTLVLSVET